MAFSDKSKKKEKTSNFRLKLSLFVFSALISGYIFRAFYISFYSGNLKNIAESQKKTTIVLKGKRGEILSSENEVLAKDIPSYSLWINPLSISRDEKKREAVLIIAGKLGIKPSELEKKLSKKTHFIWLKRQLSEQEFASVSEIIKKYGLSEQTVGFIKEWKRFYPYGEVTAHITGFTNVDSEGLSGLELYYDDYLKGSKVKLTVLKDALGRIIMKMPPEEPPKGNKIKTTIDIDLQLILYKELKEGIEKFKAKGAFALAMRARTGEIIAAVSFPTYNPNIHQEIAESLEKTILANFYQTVFEPGSTFKVFTIAVALEEEIVSPDDVFYCHEGEWKFQTKVINDVKKIGYANLEQIIAYSSNICAAQIALMIGKRKFWSYLDKLGFGKKTGIDLPGEERGLFWHYSKWYDLDLASLGFGHFIATTPMQIIVAFSAFANNGYVIKPFIVKQIISPFGDVIAETKTEMKDKVFSERTVQLMKKFLRAVVLYGTGKRAEIPLYLSAGKTGTSKKIENGVYTQKYFATFLGFAPYDDPEVILYVGFDEPSGGMYYGGEVAAPVFSSSLQKYFAKKMVPPPVSSSDIAENQDKIHYPTYVSDFSDLLTLSGSHQDFSGSQDKNNLSLHDVLDSLQKKGKPIVIRGYGFVQKIEEKEDKIVVFLSPQ
ncbi:Stage V sporulation protein D [bacterium HR19]|nr:Stage V sporulation protein D [bacterium HR19]